MLSYSWKARDVEEWFSFVKKHFKWEIRTNKLHFYKKQEDWKLQLKVLNCRFDCMACWCPFIYICILRLFHAMSVNSFISFVFLLLLLLFSLQFTMSTRLYRTLCVIRIMVALSKQFQLDPQLCMIWRKENG